MKALVLKHPYITLFVVWLCIFIAHLGFLYPNIMEARNFVTAREMVVDGNWILTTMDGLPRYEKPPLPTWFSAISGLLFGWKSLALLRLPSALITLALLFVMYSLSRKLTQNNTYALIASLVAATSFYIIFSGRDGTWDIFAHGFMLIGIYFLYLFFSEAKNVYLNASMAGLFIGLSFMSKGPVSHYALMLPFLLAYAIVYRFSNFKSKILPLLLLVVIVGLLSSWWAVYIYLEDTAEATRIAEKESSRWVGYELKPFYYYWSFVTQSGVWTIPAFIALLYPYIKTRVSHPKVYKMVLFWTLFSVILLSLIPTKKSRYLLPVLIPLAMTTAFYLEYLIKHFRNSTSKWETWPVYFNFGLIASIGLVFPLGAYLFFGDRLEGYYLNYILTSIALVTIAIIILRGLIHKNMKPVFFGTIGFIMAVVLLGFPIAGALLGNPQYKSVARLSSSEIPVYAIGDMAPEMVWQYGRPMMHQTPAEINSGALKKVGVLGSFETDVTQLEQQLSNYEISRVETYDINPVDSTKSGYKNRLKALYFTLEKRSSTIQDPIE